MFENVTDISSYSYDPVKKELVSYDTPNIATMKAQYIASKGFAGAMYWDVSATAFWVYQSSANTIYM